MKTYFTLLIVVCQSIIAMAQDKAPYLTKSLANDAISNVVVSTSAGGITVSGQSGEAPRVEVYIKGNNGQDLSKEEIEKRLAENYDMNISINGHELSAIVKAKHNNMDWKKSISISFKIFVPEQVSTDLKTSGGGIRLNHLKGNETFATSGGGLQIDQLSGVIRGKTSGGGIQVRNLNGKIKLMTSGGGLVLENLKGDINAHTSGGGIEGKHIEGELITSTSGGGIDLKDMNCSLDANTSAGDLDVQMVKVGKYLKLSASSGTIDMQLPSKQGFDLNLHGENISDHFGMNGFTGEWKKDHVNGSVNGGGIPVNANASSGGINLKFN
jgi:DUF4097 and DUF4098 domain-containing protein YvlB